MIIDLQRFIEKSRPAWAELESILNRVESDNRTMPVKELERFHELYELTAADLAKLTTFSAEPETRNYLESLVARAYGEIHETRDKQRRVFPLRWLFQVLPQTFRRHIAAFYLSLVITIAGCVFGGMATYFDPDSRHVTMPFGLDSLKPSERVKQDENASEDKLAGRKTTFSAALMTNNIRVSITTLAFGATWGVGTILLLFYNGVILGAVATDYIGDGQARFLLGWLMPHGVVEIPAILVAGQAGLVLALAFIGWGDRAALGTRLRHVSKDVVTLSIGFALMLVWAGFVESFLSQYHEPIIPYNAKIAFGAVELVLLTLFFARSGANTKKS